MKWLWISSGLVILYSLIWTSIYNPAELHFPISGGAAWSFGLFLWLQPKRIE